MVGFGNPGGDCGLEEEDKEAGSLNTTGFMEGSVQRAVWTCTNVSGLRRESG